jgi:Predicted acyl-CoA transferases/carnitine dehydratase
MSERPAVQPGALQHVKVLDLSRVLAGPWAAQTLGDLGAEVIKVERPGTGDDTRAWGPPYVTDPQGQPTGESAYYMCTNRNKQSVTVDFTRPEGQQIVRQLAAQCDVLIENFKTGGLAQYGLDYASLSALNPRLVYCSVTGFGQDGPYAQRAGYDFLIQGMGGLMSVTGRSDGEPGGGPMKVGVALTDILTGLYASTAILAALQAREHTGRGQHIDLALLDVGVACLANQGMNFLWRQGAAAHGQRAPQHRALPGLSHCRRPHDPGHWQRRPVRPLLPRHRRARLGAGRAIHAQRCATGEPCGTGGAHPRRDRHAHHARLDFPA